MTPNSYARAQLFGAVALLLLTVTGCPDASRTRRGPAAARRSQSDQTALFNSIREKFRRLPESSQMELTPPTVVLDARSSANGEDIEAVLLTQPDNPEGPANRILVPRGNCRFRGNVQPGDILKYYIKPDEETLRRLEETGEVEIATFDAIDLVVGQVVGENELLVAGGLVQAYSQPSKLEVWRISDDRMNDIGRSLGEYVERRQPPLGWQPSPDEAALSTLTELLNQWLRQSRAAGGKADRAGWSRPDLLASLPAEVAEHKVIAPLLSDDNLATGYFTPNETRLLQAATWNRDIAAWARDGATSPSDIGVALLDWVARNVQPVEADEVPPRLPWEAALHGRAPVATIAELLVGLCRQQGLTTAVLEVPVAGDTSHLLVGVLDGDQLRLLDPELGLPLPGAEQGKVATLAEALAADAVLRRLDLPDSPYPVTAEALAAARVFVAATPIELARRSEVLSVKLGGEDKVLLHKNVDAEAERLKQAGGVTQVALWPAPLEAVIAKHGVKKSTRRQAVREFLPFSWRPQLWLGRMQHLRGANLDAGAEASVSAETANDHLAARQRYTKPTVRPSSKRLARVTENKRDIYRTAKTLATLFVAQLSYDGESYKTARRWLEEPTFSDEFAAFLRPSVDYNLGRVLEQLGENEAAIAAYESVTGPRSHGARVLAERLRASAAETADEAP